MAEFRSFCRLCLGTCGTRVEVDDEQRIVSVKGDKQHAMSAGYACMKGLAAPELHNGPDRILMPLKRVGESFETISSEQALDEIAERIEAIRYDHGANSIGLYNGTQAAFNALAVPMAAAWMAAIGSQSTYSTMTVDQSAKWVAAERLGSWGAGPHGWEDADVWMFFGTNPLVSIVGGVNGFISQHPDRRLRAAKRRGMKLIVVDPRRTETAQYADVFLQIRPGEDVTLAAGMLRMILAEGWHDKAFCRDNVMYLDELRSAVEPFEEAYVAQRAGISISDLRQATALFAQGGKRGCAYTGTGPSMSPHSNLAEHLVQSLNVVCGRYIREGEPITNPGAGGPVQTFPAQAYAPRRGYESAPRGNVGDYRMLFGERMSCILADDILSEAPDRVCAMIVSGANPVATLPDQLKVVRAFRSLDLLVAIEPYMTSTAKLADYILPPRLIYERPDVPMIALERALYPEPFCQYTPAIADPPGGSDVVHDWYVFWALAKRLGRTLSFCGVALPTDRPPDSEQLIAMTMTNATVPFEEIRRYPGGAVFPVAPVTAAAPDPATKGRFEVAPPDVAREVGAVLAEPSILKEGEGAFTHLLVVRRVRETVNTLGPHLSTIRRRMKHNKVQVHGADLTELGLQNGDAVEIVSEHGRIPAIIEEDDTLRPGVASMAHGWGGLPDEGLPYETAGSSPTLLISTASNLEPINAMARLSSIPVKFERRRTDATALSFV